MRRHVLLGTLLALPLALLASSTATPLAAVTAALPAMAALIVLDRTLSARFDPGTAFWVTVLGAYGTAVFPLIAHAPDGRRAVALLLGALAVTIAPRKVPWSRPRAAAFVLLAAAALLVGRTFAGSFTLPDARALFGSRHGLLFWTPLLGLGFAGLAVHFRRHRRRGTPVAAFGLLPLVAAPFLADGGRADRWDAALPALVFGVAAAWDALSARLLARPSWLIAAAVAAVGVPNLLFMEQYRYTLRRDDTVRFPDVSEGNARMIAGAVGSPVAWPANWLWSASTGLPASRWDLLSAQRLDPRRGVRVDIGDLEQDATFLLAGWSVRHPCGDAICREVEGRAEIAVPLERESAAALHLFVRGTGELRVSLNGEALGTIEAHGGFGDHGLPGGAWRRGMNRIVLESRSGTQLVDRLELERGER